MTRQHLRSISELGADGITELLDLADHMRRRTELMFQVAMERLIAGTIIDLGPISTQETRYADGR